jgi:heptosyltransferase III
MTPARLQAVLISARNIGDAVVAVSFLDCAAEAMPSISWCVWSRPETEFLFRTQPNVTQVLVSHFPIGTDKRFGLLSIPALVRHLSQLRRQRPALSVDLFGDFREAMLGKLISRGRHYSPRWPANHPFRKILRLPPAFVRPNQLEIRSDAVNVYECNALFCRALAQRIAPTAAETPCIPADGAASSERQFTTAALRVGIHPFTSMACKRWTDAGWRDLMQHLIGRGFLVFAFGAAKERPELIRLTSDILPHEQILTLPLPRFYDQLRGLDLLIGLDSFSVHAAHAQGVPSITINGSNHPSLFLPSSSIRVAAVAHCGNQPCMNIPTCIGSSEQYACTRRVTVEQVTQAVDAVMQHQRLSTSAEP